MTFRALLLTLLLLLAGCTPPPEKLLDKLALPMNTTQVLLVTTADWNAPDAMLQRMERQADGWHPLGEAIPAKVGRNGLGWGLGLHAVGEGVQKQEGDGKAPAGIFSLGTAFGYATQPPTGLKMPYRVASERDYFIDAVDSPDYNQWRSIAPDVPNEPKALWSSFERMRRADQQYEYGMVVAHNTVSPLAGRGSAIFLHVWLDPNTATSGCTAMSREHLLSVLTWLNPAANPLLVQVPADQLADLSLPKSQ